MNRVAYLFLALTLYFLVACSTLNQNKSLYQALGRKDGIEKIVDTFIEQIGTSDQIFHYFADANVTRFREQLVLHLCVVSNGPCQYTGDTMEDIHTGMKINEADFNRVVELLVEAMKDNQISFATQNRLLAKLAPMRASIIKR